MSTSAANAGVNFADGSRPAARYFLLWQFRRTMHVFNDTTDKYFSDVLVPYVNELGIGPVGVFQSWFGKESLSGSYALLPCDSAEPLIDLNARLERMPGYLEKSAKYRGTVNGDPPFVRLSSSLLKSFDRLPGINVPSQMRGNSNRIFELRTYAQPTIAAHESKVSMFESEEAAVLENFGFHAVFYARNLVGENLPCLTYMWVYESLDSRQKAEEKFFAAPAVRALFSDPKYASSLTSTIDCVILRPAACSQI